MNKRAFKPEIFKKKQNTLFYLTVVAFVLFIVAIAASEWRYVWGFNPHFAGDNFAFNIMFLLPSTIICIVIMYFTGGLTIMYWKKLPNLPKKMLTLILSISVLLYIAYVFILILRQH